MTNEDYKVLVLYYVENDFLLKKKVKELETSLALLEKEYNDIRQGKK